MRLNNMRFNYSKLTTPIEIYELKAVNENGMPQKPQETLFLKCFARVESVSLKDYQTSVQTGTQYEIKVLVRNYPGIDNKMTLQDLVTKQKYSIKHVLYNYRQSGFSVLVCEDVTR